MLTRTSSCLAVLAACFLSAAPPPGEPTDVPRDVSALRAHYGRVLRELSGADTSHLDASQQAGRARALQTLATYRERGDFGVDLDPSDRNMAFVDHEGRRCAVAFLLDDVGEHGLVEEIARLDNDAYVAELTAVPGLAEALDRMGLSVAEAARIQAPIGPSDQPWEPEINVPGDAGNGSSAAALASPWAFGRGATTATSSSDRSGAETSRAVRGQSGRVGSGRRAGPTTATSARATVLNDWRLWWEMNKLRFLEANRLADHTRGAVSPSPQAGASSTWLGGERSLAAETLRAALGDADAQVRGRAAVAYARIVGREALPDIAPLLHDGQLFVREAAILAHGASGAPSAVPTLLELARSGTLADGSEPSPATRELAMLALGLGRRAGLRDSIDPLVAHWLGDETEDPFLAHGAMLYHALAGDEELDESALRWLDDEDAFSVLRCRATESLGLGADPEHIGPLSHALGSKDRQVRRSAALALGQLQHPLVVGPLQTAFELERNPVTRGFLLLAMAEHGGDDVRRMLTEVFQDGDRVLRPFAALALGLQARLDDDELSRRTLRKALDDAHGPDERGALMLAAGMARDAAAVPQLARLVSRESEPDARMLAALALGMTGHESALETLRERLVDETSELALTGVAQAVALFGDSDDAPALLQTLQSVKAPDLHVLVAVAVAFHGTPESLDGLGELARSDSVDAASRATALEALGLMLDEQPGLQLARLTRNSNFRAFPDWLVGVLTRSTL